VADRDHEVCPRRREHGFEGLVRLASGLRRMEGRATARVDDASLGKPQVADALGDGTDPFGLGVNRLAGELSGHREGRS
jgi:hypothetical protein